MYLTCQTRDHCQCPYYNVSKNENGHVKHFAIKQSILLFSEVDIHKPVCKRKTVSLYHYIIVFLENTALVYHKIRKIWHY